MPTDHTDDIEPLVPIMPTEPATNRPLPDGGRRPALSRPPRTDHAIEYERDTEEILPFVADLR